MLLTEGNNMKKNTNTQSLDIEQIHQNQEIILDLYEKRCKHEKIKEDTLERLYEELDALKHNKEFQKIKPFYLDLISLYDRMADLKKEDDALSTICDELLEVLQKQNIQIIKMQDDILDLSLQKVIDIEIVDDAKAHSKVVKVLRDGFRYKDKLLRPQEVTIGAHIKL